MKYKRKISIRTAAFFCVCCLVCAAGFCWNGSSAWAAESGGQGSAGERGSAGEQKSAGEWESAGEQGSSGEPGKKKRIEYVSELYDTREQLPVPEPATEDEAGEKYYLTAQDIEAVPVAGRNKILDGEILYQGVDREAGIPETAEFDVTDKESRKTFTASLPLYTTSYENERWDDLLRFTVTFHEYGADSYVLGETEIPAPEILIGGDKHADGEERRKETEDGSGMNLDIYEEELLGLLGMTQEDCWIESCEWAGEPYRDEEGILCRDAAVYGKLRVFDCRAVYRGKTKLPDWQQWRLHAVYTAKEIESAQESYSVSAATAAELPTPESDTSPVAESGIGFWEKVKQAVKLCVEMTFGILFILMVIGGFRFLVRMAKKLDRQWKDADERRKH